MIPAWQMCSPGRRSPLARSIYESATGPLFAALLFLMGMAPLSAWGRSTAKTLGRAIWKPTLVSLAVLVVALLGGMRHWAALLGFWLAALVVAVTPTSSGGPPGRAIRCTARRCRWPCGSWPGATGAATVVTSSTWAWC